jgi:hypothetical protein
MLKVRMSPTTRRVFLGSSTLFLSGCAVKPKIPTLVEIGIYSAGQGSAFLPYAQAIANEYNARGLKANIGLAGTRPSNAIHNRVLKFHPSAVKLYREIGQPLAVNP